MKTIGIYSITNLTNNKTYYGSSEWCEHRISVHKSHLKKNKHGNHHLQRSWNKHGGENFRFEIIEEIPPDKLYEVEQCYLDLTKQIPEWFYNVSVDAKNPNRGIKQSPERCLQRSITMRKAWKDGRFKDLIWPYHCPWLGKKRSKEARERMRQSQYGLRNQIDKNTYCFSNANGENFIGLRYDFTRKYNIKTSQLSRILSGERKSHKGWTLRKVTNP